MLMCVTNLMLDFLHAKRDLPAITIYRLTSVSGWRELYALETSLSSIDRPNDHSGCLLILCPRHTSAERCNQYNLDSLLNRQIKLIAYVNFEHNMAATLKETMAVKRVADNKFSASPFFERGRQGNVLPLQ